MIVMICKFAPDEITPVTVWKRFNDESNKYEHNHYDTGHIDQDKPTPVSPEQRKAWKKALWEKRFSVMVNNEIV